VTSQAVAADQWTERRRRVAELGERWAFAAEVLRLYGALLPVQQRVYEAARAEASDPSRTAAYVAERALPLVREVTTAAGPEKLAQAVAGEDGSPARWEETVRCWLAGGEVSAVDRYLVRAAAGPVLEALGETAGGACRGPRDQRHCPRCGGLPQLSVFASTSEDLVAPRRYLECARCAARWPFPRMTCAACGETETGRLPIFVEEGATLGEATGSVVRGAGAAPGGAPAGPVPRFPHMSIHACRTCARYLLNIDLGRDGRAVPVVDEVAAIPLGLYAREQGLAKIVPNLMGL
jgi:hypothetical protein